MNQVTGVIDSYQNGKAAAIRVVDVIDADTVDQPPGAEEIENVEGTVTYHDVTFRYPDREEAALDDVNFSAEAGQTVGIVGPTGAGKSTLVKLLFRFYDPLEGVVRLDGRDLRTSTVESLRESLGYVSQDPFLFYGSVRENVVYSRPDIDETEVVRAAKLAGAHEFIQKLPDGYDTLVGERGIKLSGGQRQRVALARAIVRDPEILVLDEATSHVDNETEVLIQRSLDELGKNRTMFLIAHRLSTVRDADRIVVLDEGQIVETGTHEELLDSDGLYANLWSIQLGDVDSLPETFLERIRRREVTE